MSKTKPRATRLGLIILASLALFAGLGGGIAWWTFNHRPVTLLLSHNLESPSVISSLETQVREFTSLFPRITVQIRPETTSSNADLWILTQYPENPETLLEPPSPWSGSLWVLAAHNRALEALAKQSPETGVSLREGSLAPEKWPALLELLQKEGFIPITLGNSHGWPFVLWLQVWTGATLGADAVSQFPLEAALSGGLDNLLLKSSKETLSEWRARGWFNPDTWSLGWAQGLTPLNEAKAAFALLNESQLSALSQETRGQLTFLPLPHRPGDRPWTLGSAQYLAIPQTSPNPQEAKQLLEFLTSPGVTARLSQATGRPFFSWSGDNRRPPQVLDAWISRSNTPELDALTRWLSAP